MVDAKETPKEKDRDGEETDKSSIKTPYVSVKKIKPDLRKKELPLVDLKVTNPIFEFTPKVSPAPIFRETAFAGTLRFSETNEKYYLETNSAEAITLEVPDTIALEELIGRRIFAIGKYDEESRTLVVADISDLEIFPEELIPVPTTEPTPSPTPEPTLTPTLEPDQPISTPATQSAE